MKLYERCLFYTIAYYLVKVKFLISILFISPGWRVF